jgi:hypothetical protein
LSAFFDYPGGKSFDEEMIFAQQKVAVATCHASRCITVQGANLFYTEIIKNIFEQGMETLGEAVFAAKQKILSENTTNDNIYGPAVLQTILGDPALRLKGDPVKIQEEAVNGIKENHISVFTNPFTKGLDVTIESSVKSNFTLHIYNVSGRIIRSYHINGNHIQNIGSNLKPGIYFLKAIGLKKKVHKELRAVKIVKIR